ncbi:hypothetical protein [Acinetobacter soli]|uniref:Uncharacterized protein n=1 Tax=Acinetobacter soli TaxID=487316 RepID=A0AB38Z0R4_9GAMM|nr:hypothetical protein [Acinetobacter soli]KQC95175.1 hypothetical protein APD01_14595 [Acinetobacter soli]MBV6551143.1 hypothetical protein [Acinetobacter soli]MDQ8940987.1 hypothetical protein [Acinetobacter soli]WEH93392.1 hypothetical protein PYR75_03485 [Acinetobacter soli]WEH99221.1 hypothetical protein PYR76_04945 [Acinetobacter soli]
MYGPIRCAIDFVCMFLHLEIILLMNPLMIALCSKAFAIYQSNYSPEKRLFNISVPKEFLDYIRPSFHPFDYDTKQLEQRWQKELNLKLQ